MLRTLSGAGCHCLDRTRVPVTAGSDQLSGGAGARLLLVRLAERRSGPLSLLTMRQRYAGRSREHRLPILLSRGEVWVSQNEAWFDLPGNAAVSARPVRCVRTTSSDGTRTTQAPLRRSGQPGRSGYAARWMSADRGLGPRSARSRSHFGWCVPWLSEARNGARVSLKSATGKLTSHGTCSCFNARVSETDRTTPRRSAPPMWNSSAVW
jgi:hypothetical protein